MNTWSMLYIVVRCLHHLTAFNLNIRPINSVISCSNLKARTTFGFYITLTMSVISNSNATCKAFFCWILQCISTSTRLLKDTAHSIWSTQRQAGLHLENWPYFLNILVSVLVIPSLLPKSHPLWSILSYCSLIYDY